MELDFVKMHGLGNDFVFIDDLSREIELTDDQVRFLCDRHFGIGGDGVILVRPPVNDGSIAYMHYINSDGTLAQMCGNGVRCFAKYLVDRGFVPEGQDRLIVDTLAGPRPISFERDDEGKLATATVDMGTPIIRPDRVPTTLAADATDEHDTPFVLNGEIDSPWGPFRFTCVSMGNPHAVCYIDDFGALDDALFPDANAKDLPGLDVDLVGSYFESHDAFPEKTNVEFAHLVDDGVSMRVYERGCGETMACGTGACATAVAGLLSGRTGRSTTLHLNGGDLDLRIADDDTVFMTGPATEVFSGTIDLSR